MSHTQQLILKNLTSTINFAENLAKLLPTPVVICLTGELGSGKTQFVKSFGKALGIQETIISPTFLKMMRYQLNDNWLVHLDAYQLTDEKAVLPFLDYLDADYVLIEWPELFLSFLEKYEVVHLKWMGSGADSRTVEIKSSYKIRQKIHDTFSSCKN